jgi:hypothetical protein
VVNPQKSLDYVQRNRKKKIVPFTFVTNTDNNIGVGSSFNSLINSCIVHLTGVLLVPFIASVQISGFGHSQWKSGQNVLQSTLQYNSEHFLDRL